MCSLQDSLEELASQGSFVAHGRQYILYATIGRPKHHGRVRAAGASVTIKQYIGSTPRTSRKSSSMAPKDLEQLMQKIKDRLQGPLTLFQPDAILVSITYAITETRAAS